MTRCTGGGLEARGSRGKRTWWLLLYLIDDEQAGRKKYRKRYIATDIPATRQGRKQAEQALEEAITRYSPQGLETSFADYCRQWLQRKRGTVEQTTYEGYVYKSTYIIDYFMAHPTPTAELGPQHAKALYDYLLAVKGTAPARRHDEGLGNRSIQDIAVLFRSIVDDAYVLDYLKDPRIVDKIKRVKYPQRPETREKRPFLGPDDIAIFLTAIRGHRLETAYKIALYYGLRREEICGLQWQSIRNGRIYIEHTVARVKTTISKDRTKTDGSRRDHPIPPEIASLLDEVKRRQRKNCLKVGAEYHDTGYVFTWEDGRPYAPDYYTKSFKKIVRRTEGLDDRLHLHDLRASCVSILVNGAISPKAVQSWTGHDDAQTMFAKYARTGQEQEAEIGEFLRKIMF